MCGTLQAFPCKDKRLKPVPVVTSKLSRNDRLRFEYFYIEAARQQSAGHYDAAFDLLQHALSINPQASEAYFELASYYSAMKNDSLGLVCLEKAARLNPESDTYLERLGGILYRNSEIYQSHSDVRKSLVP
jgi:tetratricopeptide (TPR) repeat protein